MSMKQINTGNYATILATNERATHL